MMACNEGLVSVIVVNYNGGDVLRKCLESIRRQSYRNIEIIVVDNCSKDSSINSIKELSDVRLIMNHRNLGFATANNIGIRTSNGEVVMLVNNDLILDPRAISTLVEIVQKYDCMAGGLIFYLGQQKIWSFGGLVSQLTGFHWHLFQGSQKIANLPSLQNVDYIPGAMLMIKKSRLYSLGLLSERYFLYGEDVDLCLKAIRKGYKVIVTSGAIGYHEVSHAQKERSRVYPGFGYFYSNVGMFRLILTHFPIPLIMTAFISIFAFSLLELIVFRRSISHFVIKINAIACVLGDIKTIKCERKAVGDIGPCRLNLRFKQLVEAFLSRVKTRAYRQ